MRRRRTFLLVFLILVIILIIGVAALVMLGGGLGGGIAPQEPLPTLSVPEFQPTPEIQTERIVVALQTIPRGMRIPPDAVEVREWPVDDNDYPADPVEELDDVVGMVARAEIPMHRPISAAKVKQVYLGEGSEISLAIPRGKVAIAVPVMTLSAVANAIRPNDRVDVLVSFSIVEVDQDSQIRLPVVLVGGDDCLAGCQPTGEQIPRLVSQYSVQNALVMGIGLWQGQQPDIESIQPSAPASEEAPSIPVAEGAEEAPPEQPSSVPQALTQVAVVTLAVSPQDALVLKWAWESNASMDLVMRSAGDNDIYAQPEAVTLQYMVDRFQIALPPKLPHTPVNHFEYRLIEQAQESAASPPQE
jgi:Flp pilus assembly protein CpaB